MKNILLILLILTTIHTTFAANIVAVLEITPSSDAVSISIQEFRHLTDELRKQAAETLPKEYTVLTRENIFQLIPPDEEEANCLAESCTVEIGRAIGADYVAGGTVGMFQGMLTVQLYESTSGKLISSFVVERESARGLLAEIREKAAGMFGKLSEPEFSEFKNLQNEQATSHLLLTTNQKSKPSFWIAIGLDVLGAVALGFGTYQQIKANEHYNDYKKTENYQSAAEHKAALDKANDARKTGNIALIAGGVLLAAGISVHVWF